MDKTMRILLFLLIVTAVGISAGILGYRWMFHTAEAVYGETEEIIRNPYIGFAPSADYYDAVGDNQLVYVQISFRELEPEEGVYDFETIAENYFLEEWKAAGKKVVLRFVCDKPSQEAHMDIPDWLYEKTKDGTFYDNSYGKGYAPDYSNETFLSYHTKAVEALGAYFSEEDFVAYVELGSIGHWGEWHVNVLEDVPALPEEDICEAYVVAYTTAFPGAKLLMRRNFSWVTAYGMGEFNDMTGDKEATNTWLSWMKEGSTYEFSTEEWKLDPVKNLWESAPVGGEFSSGATMEEYLTTLKDETIALIEASHMSFVGPNCPIANVEEENYPQETKELLQKLGYCYGVTKSKTTYNKLQKTLKVQLTMANTGSAPLYFDWEPYVYVLDEEGEILSSKALSMELTSIAGGKKKRETITLDNVEEGAIIGIGVVNPQTGEAAMNLNMDTEKKNGIYYLCKIE